MNDSPSPIALGNALPVFRPQAAGNPALLERTLCGREHIAKMLTERARDSALDSARHQQLVYGPRGSGKTHLLTVVFHRLRADAELCDRLFIVRLAEEQWEIATFFDLCVQILRRLAEEYPTSAARDWQQRLTSGPRPSRQTDAPVAELRQVALRLIQDTLGKAVLLLLVENLDDLFGTIGQEGQAQLRAHIQAVDNWCLIASAQSLFREILSRSEPFFGFFQTHELAPLDFASTLAFLRRLAVDPDIGNAALAQVLWEPQGEQRVRVIHLLCGGNHRLLTMLYPFLSGDGLVNLVDPFIRMIDRELTPYYQERLRWLPSAQQRKLVTWLARQEEPQAVKTIARNSFITEQVASAQLRKLAETGFVRLNSKGRETFCEVREPLLRFVLDFQEHRDGAVRTVVRLLKAWYSMAELQQLEVSEKIKSQALYHQCVRAALQEFISSSSQFLPEENDIPTQVAILYEQKRFADALAVLESLSKAERSQPESYAWETLILTDLGRWQEAERSYQEVQKVLTQSLAKPVRAKILFLCGISASKLGWMEVALKHYQEALAIYRALDRRLPLIHRPDLAATLNNLGTIQRDLNDLESARASYEEALASYRQLAQQLPEVYRPYIAGTFNNPGAVQRTLNDLETTRTSYVEALSIRRELAQQRPDIFRSNVATTAFNLGLLEDFSNHVELALHHYSESVQALLPEYLRVSQAYLSRFRKYLKVWLSYLYESRGGQAAWEAWRRLAGELPVDDPVGWTFSIVTGLWVRRWHEVIEKFHQHTALVSKLDLKDQEEIASVFVGALRNSEIPTSELQQLVNEMPKPLRLLCEEKVIALVPSMLRNYQNQQEQLWSMAERGRAVFGQSETIGKAITLLEAGVNYLKSGKQESAILNLPVEQRRLIMEACGADTNV